MPGSPRLALQRIEEAARLIDPVFLASPQYECESLSDELGVRLVLKVETCNPIRSFKGRGAELFLARDADDAPLVCASAGNFGQALAYACRSRALRPTRCSPPNAPTPQGGPDARPRRRRPVARRRLRRRQGGGPCLRGRAGVPLRRGRP
jgi:threonine dehydratase